MSRLVALPAEALHTGPVMVPEGIRRGSRLPARREHTMSVRFDRAPSIVAALIAAVLIAAGLLAPAEVAAQKSGGTLRVAILGEPPALDPHWTTATLTEIITGHYLEGLFTRDKNYQPTPMLAEG